jgi:hypothetical protein
LRRKYLPLLVQQLALVPARDRLLFLDMDDEAVGPFTAHADLADPRLRFEFRLQLVEIERNEACGYEAVHRVGDVGLADIVQYAVDLHRLNFLPVDPVVSLHHAVASEPRQAQTEQRHHEPAEKRVARLILAARSAHACTARLAASERTDLAIAHGRAPCKPSRPKLLSRMRRTNCSKL